MKNTYQWILLLATLLPCLLGNAQEEPAKNDLDYRAIRREARGREHEKAETPRGTIFYKVKILSIYDTTVTIEHQDGRAILKYDSIPKEWVKEFGLVERGNQGTSSRRSTARKSPTPELDLSATVVISGDKNSGAGMIIQMGETYYVYTDCATLSGNSRITIQSENGQTLQYAKMIECAEGHPLARIQVKLSGDEVKARQLAENDACSDVKVHQYLYPLVKKEKLKAVKFRAATEDIITLQSSVRDLESGTAIVLASKSVLGIFIGNMPTGTEYHTRALSLLRLDKSYTWKKVRLSNYLAARSRIEKFDQGTQLLKAFTSCQLADGKVTIPPDTMALFKKHPKNNGVMAMITLRDRLAKKSLRVNKKELNRKLTSIIGGALRSGKKELGSLPPSAFSWYHRHFLTQVITRRKSAVQELER